MIGEYVLVRCNGAGVHHGTLEQQNGTAVILTGARRLWRWAGERTLHEVSLRGVGQGSRISEAVGRILLTQVCEVIPCTTDARLSLDQDRWDE